LNPVFLRGISFAQDEGRTAHRIIVGLFPGIFPVTSDVIV